MIQAVKGTRDILPAESGKWQFAEAAARRVFRRYGFREIRTPVFESTELFARGIGEGTDIVSKEMYTFRDRGERSLTLRPENTAPVVRAAIEHGLFQRADSERLYYIGPMFRYERPQKGRMRQFHQIGVEAFGSVEPAVDAEVIEMSTTFLAQLGIADSDLIINSVGCAICRPAYKERLRAFLLPRVAELCPDCQRRLHDNPLRILDCKAGCRALLSDAPTLLESLDAGCREHFDGLRRCLDLLEVRHRVDPHLVRGLDYYVRTTFEILGASLGAQNALLGGGRYDRLVEDLGGPSIPGVGFASGLDRLVLSLPAGAPAAAAEGPDFFVALQGRLAFDRAFRLTRDLRRLDLWVEMDPRSDPSLKAQTRRADQLGARRILFLGDDEIRRGVVAMKKMADGSQRELPLDDLAQLAREAAVE
ncbi:MAG TPA: histidine--tRNA ligase [Candidatus Polarisedimenticolia bacterium]|jgi:histidyl-tRNA synthetase|nr:histidine--tRNA ligase [Candidatus Polarisedimenticolia bacterium]